MDLIRRCLIEVEENATHSPKPFEVVIEGVGRQLVFYHLKLLLDQGYIKGLSFDTKDGVGVYPTELTWEGHELLDSIRSEKVWSKIKAKIKEEGGDWTVNVLKGLGTKIIEQQLSL